MRLWQRQSDTVLLRVIVNTFCTPVIQHNLAAQCHAKTLLCYWYASRYFIVSPIMKNYVFLKSNPSATNNYWLLASAQRSNSSVEECILLPIMAHYNPYIWRRIVAFCDGTKREIEEMRQTLFGVSKRWRHEFKLHLWLHPTSAYCKALKSKNYRVANALWDFSGDCIDCRPANVARAVFIYGTSLHMKRIIDRDDFEPACHDNYAIRCASENGHADVVQLLLQDKRVDPAADNNYAIVWASQNGHVNVVQLLLQDPRVDPAADNNYAIGWASRNGHINVVQLLLQDPRVDPAGSNNLAIRFASSYGHTDVVQLLLQDPRVDPGVLDNFAVRRASMKGHVEVVRLLLQDPRVNPAAENNCAIRYASSNSYADVVRLLLQDPRVDPAVDDNWPIRYASEFGHAGVVELLLQDKRVDPAANDNYSIRWASHNNHASVVQLLLQDPRVDPDTS